MTAIGALPDALQQAVVLRELRGLTYEEVAASLDIPVGTVRSRLSAGRALLREALGSDRERPAVERTFVDRVMGEVARHERRLPLVMAALAISALVLAVPAVLVLLARPAFDAAFAACADRHRGGDRRRFHAQPALLGGRPRDGRLAPLARLARAGGSRMSPACWPSPSPSSPVLVTAPQALGADGGSPPDATVLEIGHDADG